MCMRSDGEITGKTKNSPWQRIHLHSAFPFIQTVHWWCDRNVCTPKCNLPHEFSIARSTKDSAVTSGLMLSRVVYANRCLYFNTVPVVVFNVLVLAVDFLPSVASMFRVNDFSFCHNFDTIRTLCLLLFVEWTTKIRKFLALGFSTILLWLLRLRKLRLSHSDARNSMWIEIYSQTAVSRCFDFGKIFWRWFVYFWVFYRHCFYFYEQH